MIGLLIYLFSIVSIYWFWVRNGWLIVWLLIDVIKYDFLTCDSFHERKLGVSMQDLKAYITGIWSFPSIIDFYYESRFSCRFPFWIINHKDLLTLTSNQDFPKNFFFERKKGAKEDTPRPSLEPTTSRSIVLCLIHWATRVSHIWASVFAHM